MCLCVCVCVFVDNETESMDEDVDDVPEDDVLLLPQSQTTCFKCFPIVFEQ